MPIRRYMMIRPFSIVPWKAHVAVRSFIPAIVSQPRAQCALSERTLEANGAGSARLTGGITSESSGDSRLGPGSIIEALPSDLLASLAAFWRFLRWSGTDLV